MLVSSSKARPPGGKGGGVYRLSWRVCRFGDRSISFRSFYCVLRRRAGVASFGSEFPVSVSRRRLGFYFFLYLFFCLFYSILDRSTRLCWLVF